MLLFDQNLSPRLVGRLADVFVGAEHVGDVGLAEAPDAAVWEYARAHGLTIVTKDADFNDLAILTTPPPHVVWLRRGNCSTAEAEAVLRARALGIGRLRETGMSVLVLN